MSIRVAIDCDPGHDDALALLLAAGLPEIDLRAITTVSGNHSIERTTENALRICALGGIRDVPVAIGADRPLEREREAAQSIHGETGLDGARLPVPDREPDSRSALELLCDVADEGIFTLIATGPLTNIAKALPAVRGRVERIVLMGGSAIGGNWTPAAEFNIWCDPEAADIVFRSGLPVEMIGLDLTHQALATPAVRARIRSLGSVGESMDDLLGFFADAYRDVFGFAAPPVHDACAVACVARPGLVSGALRYVAIETLGVHTRGATVVDVHNRTGEPANALVHDRLDVDGFWDLVVAALGRLPVVTVTN